VTTAGSAPASDHGQIHRNVVGADRGAGEPLRGDPVATTLKGAQTDKPGRITVVVTRTFRAPARNHSFGMMTVAVWPETFARG
jgi:hypothetical protein